MRNAHLRVRMGSEKLCVRKERVQTNILTGRRCTRKTSSDPSPPKKLVNVQNIFKGHWFSSHFATNPVTAVTSSSCVVDSMDYIVI